MHEAQREAQAAQFAVELAKADLVAQVRSLNLTPIMTLTLILTRT